MKNPEKNLPRVIHSSMFTVMVGCMLSFLLYSTEIQISGAISLRQCVLLYSLDQGLVLRLCPDAYSLRLGHC